MSRVILIAVAIGLIAMTIAPALAAVPVRARTPDSPEPEVYRVIPRTVHWVMRPTAASSIVVIGHPPVIVGGPIIIVGGVFHHPVHPYGHFPPPVFVYPDYPHGPPTFFP